MAVCGEAGWQKCGWPARTCACRRDDSMLHDELLLAVQLNEGGAYLSAYVPVDLPVRSQAHRKSTYLFLTALALAQGGETPTLAVPHRKASIRVAAPARPVATACDCPAAVASFIASPTPPPRWCSGNGSGKQQATSSKQANQAHHAPRTTHLAGDAPAPGCPRCCNSPAPPPPCCCPPSSLRNSKAICLRLVVSLVIAAASHHRNHSLSPAAVAASIVAPPPKTFLFHPPSTHTLPPSDRHALSPLLSPFPYYHHPLTARRHPRIRNHG